MSRIIGIDGSSSSTGIAIVKKPKTLITTQLWTPSHAKLLQPDKLYEYFVWLLDVIKKYKPVLGIVEKVTHSRNVNTIRTLARWEGASIAALTSSGVKVRDTSVMTARKDALGRGIRDKEEVKSFIQNLYPKHNFRTNDESDALVLALAGGKND